MALDISKIKTDSTADKLDNPKDIFSALPEKQYSYLRDVQAEVLEQWVGKRDQKDVRLKMNTGGGKTLVVLLILKSCLNRGLGPAVYIAPSPFLAQQVIKEAETLGLKVDEDPRSLAVVRGRAILVTNIYVLLNGRSKFGIDQSQIPIGSVIVDDAHACLATAEQQFTLNIQLPSVAYDALFALFRNSLEEQSSTGVLEIEQGDQSRQMVVPFWSWSDHISEVESILMDAADKVDDIGFVWPLVKDHLRQCKCVFGRNLVEISPACIPINKIPSFVNAKHRVFMSATFADDGILITDFDANPQDIATPVVPGSASDIGDRLILVPQEIDPDITDVEIKELAVEVSKKYNVVVIVPSDYRAKFWADVCDLEVHADSLENATNRLNRGLVGLVVIVNKYDGIDLPHDACRFLILDGLPDVRRLIDKAQQAALDGSDHMTGTEIQKIEQGMGRGVRATDDHCAVVLMGRSLVGKLYQHNGIDSFTPATRAQFDLSDQVADQIRGQGINEVKAAIDTCLNRDPDWVAAAKSALINVSFSDRQSNVALAIARRRAFDAAYLRQQDRAVSEIQTVINSSSCDKVRGWLMSELADYTHSLNAVDAQQILSSAIGINHQVSTKPQSGVHYVRLSNANSEQANAVIERFKSIGSPNDVIVNVNAVIEELAFRPDSFRRFERNFREAAVMLGFQSQMPETEYGKGPDVLWATGELQYLVIECKNEATAETVSKAYCNQLAGSMNWFSEQYDNTCHALPVLVHPSSKIEHAATLPEGARIITETELAAFRLSLREFCRSVAKIPGFGTTQDVSKLLVAHNLLPKLLIETYSVSNN